MRITSIGQVTIPQEILEQSGLLPHAEVEFHVEGDVVVLRKAEAAARAREWLRQYRGSPEGGMTTDELVRLTRVAD